MEENQCRCEIVQRQKSEDIWTIYPYQSIIALNVLCLMSNWQWDIYIFFDHLATSHISTYFYIFVHISSMILSSIFLFVHLFVCPYVRSHGRKKQLSWFVYCSIIGDNIKGNLYGLTFAFGCHCFPFDHIIFSRAKWIWFFFAQAHYGPKWKKRRWNCHLIIHCPTSSRVSEWARNRTNECRGVRSQSE